MHHKYSLCAASDPTDAEATEWEQQVLVDLADLVLTETPQWVLDIRSAIADGDTERLRTLLDALKGSMSILGVETVCQAATEIERLITHRQCASLNAQIGKLSAMCRRAMSDLRRSHRDYLTSVEPVGATL